MRIRFLARIESLQAVGAVFHLNDLDRDTWDELVALKRARWWIDQKADDQRESIHEAMSREKKALEEARKVAGIPGPGVSLFRGKR